MNTYRFCPKCSGTLKLQIVMPGNSERLVCQKCAFVFYINPVPAVGIIIRQDQKICLVERKYAPRKDFWCLPAGFIEMYETVEAAAIRETKEETNLDIEIECLETVYSDFDSPKHHVIVAFYHGKIVGGQLKAGDDASDARFFALDEVPLPLAWHSHCVIIEKLKANQTAENR